ncbi:hypothetical protein HZH68_004915 [Vespula germanica]|uniref:Uncharacterized protein n=1 Tax=Vespula germanica TaxID=30212 RepID=A0A834KSP4_VESGE|nr:hypothetical protein HZH68_004915 [Vespula germanica]
MLKVLLILTILCGSVFTEEPTEDTKQRKRGILGGSDGWIGISNPYSYGNGQPWADNHNPWKSIKFANINLHHGGWNGFGSYGKGSFTLPSGTGHGPLVKTLPVYITKHVVLEKPVPVPEPVYIEKPYHIPVEKVIPVPIEKIIHKPVPVPVPVPQAVPIPVEHAVPVPVKHPVAVPVHQPYPVPVKQGIPIPVPVPVPVHSPYPPVLSGSFYGRGFPAGPFYPSLHGQAHFDHGFVGHGYGHGVGHGFGVGHGYGGHGYGGYGYGSHGHGGHGYGHGYGYGYGPYGYDHAHHYGHGFGHERKEKRILTLAYQSKSLKISKRLLSQNTYSKCLNSSLMHTLCDLKDATSPKLDSTTRDEVATEIKRK